MKYHDAIIQWRNIKKVVIENRHVVLYLNEIKVEIYAKVLDIEDTELVNQIEIYREKNKEITGWILDKRYYK